MFASLVREPPWRRARAGGRAPLPQRLGKNASLCLQERTRGRGRGLRGPRAGGRRGSPGPDRPVYEAWKADVTARLTSLMIAADAHTRCRVGSRARSAALMPASLPPIATSCMTISCLFGSVASRSFVGAGATASTRRRCGAPRHRPLPLVSRPGKGRAVPRSRSAPPTSCAATNPGQMRGRSRRTCQTASGRC